LIQANIFSDLFSSNTEANGGLTFALKAANPLKYNHTTGTGASYTDVTDGVLDGYYFANGEKAVLFIDVSSDSSCTGTTSTVYSASYDLHPSLTVVGITNNCGISGSASDSAAFCINSASVTVSIANGQIQFTKFGKSSRVIFALVVKLDCTQTSAYGSALTLKSYKAGTSGAEVSIDAAPIPFTRATNCYSCDDQDACTTDVVAGCYTSRTCQYLKKDCDDKSACTVDSCDKATGKCSNTPISCDDGIDCTKDSCDARKGCVHTIENCCDDDACTIDVCDTNQGGCVHTPLVCNDYNACTEEKCDPKVGCIISSVLL
jgi:hypothetical protein